MAPLAAVKTLPDCHCTGYTTMCLQGHRALQLPLSCTAHRLIGQQVKTLIWHTQIHIA